MIVDIHNYLLPIDEHPVNDEETIKFAKKAVDEGITHIIAAPHVKNRAYDEFELWIKHLVKNLNKKLSDQNIPLTILEGMEIQLLNYLMKDEAQQFLPLAGTSKYVLVEFPKNRIPPGTQKIFYEFQLKGYIPIIAHPEQNKEIINNPNKLFDLVSKGALVQVNAASFLGIQGRVIKRFVMKLCKHNLIHFVTTNSYNDKNSPFSQLKAYKVIEKKFSEDLVVYFQQNSVHIVNGTDFHIKEPIQL